MRTLRLKGGAVTVTSELASNVDVCGVTVSGAAGVLLSFWLPVSTVKVPFDATLKGSEKVTSDSSEPAFATLM